MADGIRIDALPPTIAASKEHVVPSMRDGITVKLSVGQINDLGRLATALESGTDFDDITSPGLYAVTSDVNAPLGGGRWLVACNTDPDDASSVFQTAMLLSGGMAALTFTRRSVAGVFGAWSGGLSAADISFDDAVAFPGATNVQQALEMSAAWIGDIRDVLTPQEFVAGLTLSNNAGDPNNKIDIAPGRARGNGVTVVNPAVFTATLGGSIHQPNTTYHVHALRNNTTGEFAVIFALSATSPSVPSGYTRVQRLGAIMTDGSGNIRPFVQSGNEFWHNVTDGVQDLSVAGARAKTLTAVTLPSGIRVEGIFRPVVLANTASVCAMFLYDGAHAGIRVGLTIGSLGTNTVTHGGATLRQYTNTSRQIYIELSAGANPSTPSTLHTIGWRDYQIPRIG